VLTHTHQLSLLLHRLNAPKRLVALGGRSQRSCKHRTSSGSDSEPLAMLIHALSITSREWHEILPSTGVSLFARSPRRQRYNLPLWRFRDTNLHLHRGACIASNGQCQPRARRRTALHTRIAE
jgi:hypothetical protein